MSKNLGARSFLKCPTLQPRVLAVLKLSAIIADPLDLLDHPAGEVEVLHLLFEVSFSGQSLWLFIEVYVSPLKRTASLHLSSWMGKTNSLFPFFRVSAASFRSSVCFSWSIVIYVLQTPEPLHSKITASCGSGHDPINHVKMGKNPILWCNMGSLISNAFILPRNYRTWTSFEGSTAWFCQYLSCFDVSLNRYFDLSSMNLWKKTHDFLSSNSSVDPAVLDKGSYWIWGLGMDHMTLGTKDFRYLKWRNPHLYKLYVFRLM